MGHVNRTGRENQALACQADHRQCAFARVLVDCAAFRAAGKCLLAGEGP
ncbi:MAG: hypothetical protein ACJASW_001147 [Polaribacter sp.]|jgi:hypothetical protein